jgi:GntR family transcriptional regulator of vanillate catabolism
MSPVGDKQKLGTAGRECLELSRDFGLDGRSRPEALAAYDWDGGGIATRRGLWQDAPRMDNQQTRAVLRIREMILRGELVPGQRVAEAGLAELLGISRTPVRQALPALAEEGLLTEHGTRGYVVRAFTEAEIDDAIELRGMLEGFAARKLVERGTSRKFLRELHDLLEDGDRILRKKRVVESDETLYAEMNRKLHAAIVLEADSTLISSSLDRNNRVPFASPQAVAFNSSNLDEVYESLSFAHRQHHDIVSAIEGGQSARVETLMREHALRVKANLRMNKVSPDSTDRTTTVRLAR